MIDFYLIYFFAACTAMRRNPDALCLERQSLGKSTFRQTLN